MTCVRTWMSRVVFALLLVGSSRARADVGPGDVVTAANVDNVKDLISPGVEWCVRHGMQMKIAPYKEVKWPKAYREATDKYAEQVKLAADGRSLIGHVAGLPFPHLDPNDPQIALKIMWNFAYKPFWTDDVDLRNLHAETGPVVEGKPMSAAHRYLVDHFRALFYDGRVAVDPKPELPNHDGVRYKLSLHPILEPFDLKGCGEIAIRYLSPDRQDDTWLYLPSVRRVRRLDGSRNSDALFGQDIDADSYGGFAGQIVWFDWKFLGERDILASFHSQEFPVRFCEGEGDFIFCDAWEKRRAYVVEGTPKSPQYAYGKRLLFIDKETYFIAYSDIFDRQMQLWKVFVNEWSFKKRATPTYGDEYEDDMPFNPSVTMVDIQLGHATRAALPSTKYPGEQGWYFNQGAKAGLTEEFFTVAHLIESGH